MTTNLKAKTAAVLALVLLGSACASAPRSAKIEAASAEIVSASASLPEESVADDNSDAENVNVVAPGFEFQLSSGTDKQLNGKYRVSFEGKLNLPYGVSLDPVGMTVAQAKRRIVDAFQGFFKGGDQVGVVLSGAKYWVEVRGLVGKPGRYLVSPDSSIEEVIALAGGLNASAGGGPQYVKVEQPGLDAPRIIDLKRYFNTGNSKASPRWRGGDLVFFQHEPGRTIEADATVANQIHLLGEVRNPGNYYLIQGGDLLQYVAKAGGPTAGADVAKITLYRTSKDGVRVAQELDLNEPSQHIPLLAGDTLIVASIKPTPFEKFIQVAQQVGSLISTIALLIIAL